MKAKYLISMTSTQTVDNHDETVEFTLPCNYIQNNDVIKISYEEYTPKTQQKYFSNIKVKNSNLVTLHRKGKEEISLNLEKDVHHMGHYITDFGNISLGVLTKNIIVESDEHNCHIELDYILDVNNVLLSKNKIIINIKETTHV